MHGPTLAVLLVASVCGAALPSTTPGAADAVAEARQKLKANDGIAAVAILEDAIPSAGPNKDLVLTLLQQAYDVAARQAQSLGRLREAETFRENGKILGRKSRPSKPPTVPPEPARTETAPRIEPRADEPPALAEAPSSPTLLPDGPPSSPARPGLTALTEPDSTLLTNDLPSVEPPRSNPATDPAPLMPVAPPQSLEVDLTNADTAFAAKNYQEAGRIYGMVAQSGKLPANRRAHWLYCRSWEVVKRINAPPKNKADWVSINAEIDRIRSIDPKFMPGEYIRSLAEERQAGRKKTKPSSNLVIRGSAPEEPPARDLPVRAASNTASIEAVRPPATLTSSNAASASPARTGASAGRWQSLESANFRIYHSDPAIAAKVAKAAEAARNQQLKRWHGQLTREVWSPLCEIYLFPTAKQYAQITGQPEDSPGFSTMGMNAGRIISRRINLRTDHPTMVSAVLPHEITHVILADFFTEQQIPRWADEGLAVLAEPLDEQQRRAADLVGPLAANRVFAVDKLMQMDYPDNRYWALYYAQSVSLTRFLNEQGTPAQMLQFLQIAQREGYEVALRRIYRIEGYPDLQDRWVTYARSKSANADTAALTPATGPDLKIR